MPNSLHLFLEGIALRRDMITHVEQAFNDACFLPVCAYTFEIQTITGIRIFDEHGGLECYAAAIAKVVIVYILISACILYACVIIVIYVFCLFICTYR